MARKRLKLPRDFEALLGRGDLAALQAVFETSGVDARGGIGNSTALMMRGCPEALMRWLVAQGADLTATNDFDRTALDEHAGFRDGKVGVLIELGADVHRVDNAGQTALHRAAGAKAVGAATALVAAGANIDARNTFGETPLEAAVMSCSNIEIEGLVPLAEALLAAGAARTAKLRTLVGELGKRFELHRANFDPMRVGRVSAALDRLYAMFDVEPVARRVMHDGRSPIVVRAKTWQKQHAELWQLLVPSSGPAATVQGEVIRLSGRLAREVVDNGGINWDEDFRHMARSLGELLRTGNQLGPAQASQLDAIVESLVATASGDLDRLAELAVTWVLANPTPIELGAR